VVRRFSHDFIRALGGSDEEATIISDGVTFAALRGHPGQGQGIEKMFRYHTGVMTGAIVPNAPMQWVINNPGLSLLDAAKGFGYVAAARAMDRAVERATHAGIACAAVRHSTHFGIAGYHAARASNAGHIGIALTNSQAEMAPWGAVTPALGTNPWGIAVPNSEGPPIVLDMALTMSGKGMIRWFMRAGQKIPMSWALTADGRRTDRPAEVLDGPLLPMGDYKGSGLSFMTDVLTGILSGSKFGLSVTQDETDNDVGHLMIAIDPEVIIPREVFQEKVQALIRNVKSATHAPGQEVLIPGELEARRQAVRLREGVPVDRETIKALRALAQQMDVDFPF
jgi:LDH2 family malate/lactate/ureidoglycolate dehydrogenase